MPVETQFKTFKLPDGTELRYICDQMPATLAHKTLIDLCEIAGQPLIVSISQMFDSDGVSFEGIAKTASALLMKELDPARADDLVKAALTGVKCEGVGDVNSSSVFDEHFRGRILHMYAVVCWSIGVNYSDFFDVARSNPAIKNGLEVGTEALKLLTQTLRSGLSAQGKTDSTSETTTFSPQH